MDMGDKIINLDECVIKALELLKSKEIPKLNIKFKEPIVIGSGNAAVTGKILFNDKKAIFADESTYLSKLKKSKPDGAILISASGGKHSPIIAKELKKRKIKTILITSNENAKSKNFVDKTYTFPKNLEPYTYNTSTYLSMIFSKTNENPAKILDFLKKIKIPNLKKYNSFFFIIPEEFVEIKEMIQTKFDELFGPMLQARIFTFEQTKHAKTVINSDKELFIGLGFKNNKFGKNKLNIDFPNNSNYGTAISIAYYIIGQIQKQNKPYFKENIENYIKETSKTFNEKIELLC